jgi:BexC/CtrB/KpsE family polysaccharide export inner-membrane protein
MSAETTTQLEEIQLVLEPAALKGELQVIEYLAFEEESIALGWRRFTPSLLFSATVLLPLLVGAIYNYGIASDRFVSTASFVVRENQSGGGVISLMGGGGFSRSDDNSYAVKEYIESRDAISEINNDGYLSKIFASQQLDLFSRFPDVITGGTGEDFYKHFQHYVDVDFDVSTGITTLNVQAFSPEEAHEVGKRLVVASENLINGLNTRSQKDATRFAESLVTEAKQQLQVTQNALTDFRNKTNILSADAEVDVSSALIANLLEGITKVDTEISQTVASAAQSPKLNELRLRRDALSEQLGKLRKGLAGGDGSIAKKMEQFEAVSLQQKLAEKNLISAEAALLKARQKAATGKLYLDSVVSSNIPDKSGYPRRLFNMALIAFIGCSVFVIFRSLRDLIMEDA